jgi:NitT/TauT family transport system permease protein
MSFKARPLLARPLSFTSSAYWLADVLLIALVALGGFGVLYFIDTGSAPFVEATPISTELSAIPGYALLSLTRSLIALGISYIIAIIYGTLAAKSPRNERILIPALDVLQSLPVLTFLPGFVIALTQLFPTSRWGLEISCILMIVTGQVWNLVFAYYESQRQISTELHDFTRISKLTAFQRFLVLDLPNGVRPLVYNGMMSMAGGWFFLTLCEAFVLGEKSFQLPGLGSFLSVSFAKEDFASFWAGLVALFVMIIAIDFFVWKPLIAWVSQYRDVSEVAEGSVAPQSLFLNILKRTRVQKQLLNLFEWSREKGTLLLQRKPQSLKESSALEETPARKALANVKSAMRDSAQIVATAARMKSPSGNRAPWVQWLFSFAIGAGVFYLLPKLPEMAGHLVKIKSDDWLSLTHSLAMTSVKVFLVLVLSSLWTVPVGLWIGQRRKIAKWAEPIIQNLAAFPAPVLFPLLTMELYHSGMPSFWLSVLLLVVGNQWYLLFNVLSGASRISHELKQVSSVYRFSQWRKFTKLYFPALLPSLITGWISAAGGAWNASIVAEVVSFPGGKMVTEGIGAEITRATEEGNYPRLVAAVIVITIALIVINRTLWRSLNEYVDQVKS